MSALAALRPQAGVDTPEAYAEALYKRHNRAIFRLCLGQLRRREDADDAVQTTFIYVLQSLRRGVVPQMELPWLMTIAKNACSTRRRSGMKRGEYETTHDLDSLQDRLAAPERADVASGDDFRAALADVPEAQRKALLLREWRGLSYDEIGTELGLSQAATEALLFRARQNVAQRLSQRMSLRTLNGASLIAFLRNLLQTTAAKTAAVGAGAALTVTALPAAQPQPRVPRLHATAPAAVEFVQRASTGDPPARSQRPAQAPRTPVRRPTPHAAAIASKPAAAPRTSSPEPRANAAAAPAPAAAQPPAAASSGPVTQSEAAPVVAAVVEVPPVSLEVTVPSLPLALPTPVHDVVDAVGGVQVRVTTPAVSIKLP